MFLSSIRLSWKTYIVCTFAAKTPASFVANCNAFLSINYYQSKIGGNFLSFLSQCFSEFVTLSFLSLRISDYTLAPC